MSFQDLAPGSYAKDATSPLRPLESASLSDCAIIGQATIREVGDDKSEIYYLTSAEDFIRKVNGNSLLSVYLTRSSINWDSGVPLVNANVLSEFIQDIQGLKYNQRQVLLPVELPPNLEQESKEYLKGALVSKQGKYFECLAKTSGDFDQEKWGEISEFQIAPDEGSQKNYPRGSYVVHERKLLRSRARTSNQEYDDTKWETLNTESYQVSLSSGIQSLCQNLLQCTEQDFGNQLQLLVTKLNELREQPDIEEQLGRIACTTISVAGFFKNGGKVAYLADTVDCETFAKNKLDDFARKNFYPGLICCPGGSSETQKALVEFAGRRDFANSEGESFCFAVTEAGRSSTEPPDASVPDQGGAFQHHSSACYWPWLKTTSNYQRIYKVDGETVRKQYSNEIVIPPSAFIAGIYASTDSLVGVHQAPAGEDKVIKGIETLDYHVSDVEAGKLNSKSVNCLRQFPSRSPVVFGARTLSSDPNYRYVSVARLHMQVRKTIKDSNRANVFKPNDKALRKSIYRNIYTYLEGLRKNGALEGTVAEEAFVIVCDETNNPPELRALGQLHVNIAIAAVKPAEFIVVELAPLATLPS